MSLSTVWANANAIFLYLLHFLWSMEEGWEHHLEGSACGRYVYGVILDANGEIIDRYLYEDRMETAYGGEWLKTFVGIADAHGIESFVPLEGNESNMFYFTMRASLNRQRHALVYQVELDEEREAIIKKTLSEGNYQLACHLLHQPDFVESVGIEKSMLDSWELIPNPKLDPYG